MIFFFKFEPGSLDRAALESNPNSSELQLSHLFKKYSYHFLHKVYLELLYPDQLC